MMRWPYLSLFFFLGFQIADAQTLKWDKRFDQAVPEDWLVKPINTKANVYQTEKEGDVVLYNGLVRRSFKVAPNFKYCNGFATRTCCKGMQFCNS